MLCVSTEGRARDDDRDAAIATVEAACAAGQIVPADRDRRVEELRRAQTQTDIYLLTHDLRTPVSPAGAAEAEQWPTLAEVTRSAPAPHSRGPARLVVVVLVIFVLGLGVSAASLFFISSGPVEMAAVPSAPAGGVLTAEGYDELVAAVADSTGKPVVFDAVLYPDYAVVTTPVDATSDRYESWYWDGSAFSTSGSKGTAPYPRFDLTGVDGAVVVELVEQARALVDDPVSWYAIVRAPDESGAVVWAYASNEFSESEYLAARPDGTVTYDSTEH